MASLLQYKAPTRDLSAPDEIEQLLTAALAKRQPNVWNINDLARARDDRQARTSTILDAIASSNSAAERTNTQMMQQQAATKIADILADTGKAENPSAPDMSATAAALLAAMTGTGNENLPQLLMSLPAVQRVIQQRGIRDASQSFKNIGEGTDSFDRAGVRLDEPKINNFLELLNRAMTQGPSRDERRQALDNAGNAARDFGKVTRRWLERDPVTGASVERTEVVPRGAVPQGTPLPFPQGADPGTREQAPMNEPRIRRNTNTGRLERQGVGGKWVPIE